MKQLLPIVGFMTLAAGCASHYQEVREDKLVLYLKRPDAQQVILACSLDDFEPHKAHPVGGLWVVSLPLGDQFRYYYVIDGKMFLPPCRMKESDDFGSENCIFDRQL